MNQNAQKREEFVEQLRDYQKMVAGWIARIWHVPPDDDFSEHPDYKAALDYYRNFKETDGVDYSEVIDYAKQLYARLLDTDKLLDEKADAIVKYLGGGTALISFGALLTIKLDSPNTIILGIVAVISVIPSLILAIRAVHYSIRARKPRASALAPSVRFAVEMAEYNVTKEKTALNLWLMFYPICEAALYRNLQKSKHVEAAYRCYQWFMGLLVLPVIGISITLAFMLR